jgi:hypothetical protein
MGRLFRRLLRRETDFAHGERVVFVEDGTPGTIHFSKDGYSHVYWDDEPELGGSRFRTPSCVARGTESAFSVSGTEPLYTLRSRAPID